MFAWYRLASAFLLLQGMSAPGIVDRLMYGEWIGKPGNKVTQTLNLLLILLSLALALRGLRRFREVRTGAMIALGIVAFLFASAAWSVGPAATIRIGIVYLFVVIGAIGMATNFDADELMDQLALMGFLCAVASLVLFAVSPGSATTEDGDFRGIFSQKNVIGEAMTMGALGALHGIRTGRRRLRSLVFLVTCTILAFMSKSATSCLTIVAFCLTDWVITLLRKGGSARMFGFTLIGLAVPALIGASVFQDAMLEMIGKDPTLTGRTLIWEYVIVDIYRRPLLGWGYVAFWSPENPAAMEIADALHWFAPQAHNGLLEILLHVGFIGAGVFIFWLVRTLRLALRGMKTAASATAATSCLLSCMGILIVGISETVLLVPLEASTTVFLITGFLCERAMRAARRQHYAARWHVPAGLPQETTRRMRMPHGMAGRAR